MRVIKLILLFIFFIYLFSVIYKCNSNLLNNEQNCEKSSIKLIAKYEYDKTVIYCCDSLEIINKYSAYIWLGGEKIKIKGQRVYPVYLIPYESKEIK